MPTPRGFGRAAQDSLVSTTATLGAFADALCVLAAAAGRDRWLRDVGETSMTLKPHVAALPAGLQGPGADRRPARFRRDSDSESPWHLRPCPAHATSTLRPRLVAHTLHAVSSSCPIPKPGKTRVKRSGRLLKSDTPAHRPCQV
ncbi:hypothetical protein K466DRAFT_371765 [Polyporus arcularius HHB13444]|uniref:Uncharacterized protein n=1 Tax=Polyporus arcularius HHB13444 TaxID=1314778 RepID=A0A5C3PLJ4_9APHY|nr:hypothetical protein K466DRAFT_371765 [Polyporus arcularius HHB13444]